MNKPTLYLVRAIPGFGKTTFANTVFSGIPKFENDQYFMHSGKYEYDQKKMKNAIDWCISSVENCLKNGIDVCVSNTFTKKRFVDSYRDIASYFGAEFKVYRMMYDFRHNVHNVPKEIYDNMRNNFDDYPDELYVYPNLNQSKDDLCYRPYILTDVKIGDKIFVDDVEAVVADVRQATYDYLNIFYKTIDGKELITTTGGYKKFRKENNDEV